MIFHFLPEEESFSEYKGGAISRWAANVLRHEADTHIVCSSADDTWGFDEERIHLTPGIRKYLRFRARRLYPPQVSGPILRHYYAKDLPPVERGDVLWVHGVPALAEALLPLAKEAGAKLVFHLHSSACVTHSSLVIHRLKRDADMLVFCSDFLRAEARRRFPDLTNSEVLYNGADEKMFYPPKSRDNEHAPVVLFASRLVPEKGAHVLIDAMRLLDKRGVQLRARIFGAPSFGGSARSEYDCSLQLNGPSNVQFCGYQSGHALAQEFRKAHIFCLPATYNDPFPLAILEAMASGLAVVASRAGGIPEALSEGGGLLVPPSDSQALADTLEMLATDRAMRTEIASRAVLVFQQRFSWSIVRDAYLSIITSIQKKVVEEIAR